MLLCLILIIDPDRQDRQDRVKVYVNRLRFSTWCIPADDGSRRYFAL